MERCLLAFPVHETPQYTDNEVRLSRKYGRNHFRSPRRVNHNLSAWCCTWQLFMIQQWLPLLSSHAQASGFPGYACICPFLSHTRCRAECPLYFCWSFLTDKSLGHGCRLCDFCMAMVVAECNTRDMIVLRNSIQYVTLFDSGWFWNRVSSSPGWSGTYSYGLHIILPVPL